MRERDYQAYLIRELHELFPGCVVIKNDPSYLQGFPDLTILYDSFWAVLEVKVSERSRTQPNQEYYIDVLSEMSFAAFIYPENEQEVLDALQLAFRTRRSARISKR